MNPYQSWCFSQKTPSQAANKKCYKKVKPVKYMSEMLLFTDSLLIETEYVSWYLTLPRVY